jgi:phosphoglycerol transferase
MEIESAVPPGSSIFQYPFFPYPENGPIYQLLEYTEFLPYLHSKSLRWSYGTIKGRSGAAWQANIAGMPTDRAVDALAQAGFMGVYVARDGYRDHGAALEEALRSKLGQPVATSSQGDAAFYPLAARVQQLKAEQGEQEYERRKQEALTPMFLGWLDGCHPADVRGITQSVWCGAKGRFVVDNPSATPVHVLLGAKLKLAGPPPATVRLRSDVVEHEIDIGTASYDMWEGFDVPPGEHFFTITTSGEGAIDERGRQRQITLDGAHLEVIVRSGPFEDQK